MKKQLLISLISCTYLSILSLDNTDVTVKKTPKVLVLIIASNDKPVYLELKKIWRSYMHKDPLHIQAYFIRANPNLSTTYKIEGDTIWCKSYECLIPGVLNKTILALEALLPRIENEFDYVLRTNLSSFYIFPRLLDYLQNAPKTNFYAGYTEGYLVSGAGMLMSPDIVRLLVENKNEFMDQTIIDDECIADFLHEKEIKATHHHRIDIMPISMWDMVKDQIPNDVFQFRIKNDEELRLKHDIYIHKKLLKMFYNIKLK